MTSLREVITKWGFQIEHEKLDKAEKQLEGIKHTLEFLAVAEVVRGIIELTEKFATFAEELHVAAESAGITVEAFQKMAFAAKQSTVSQEELGTTLARLGRQLYQARRGSVEAQNAFAQVGISAEQIQGFHTSQDAMLVLADRFKGIQDPIQKQALAMQLLGRGSVNMVGFLSQGSAAIKAQGDEAERLGIVLSHGQVEALVKVEHAMQRLWGVMKGVAATIAAYFAPSVETAIKDFLQFYEINRKLIDTNIRAWIWDITYALGFVYQAVKFVVQAFFDFAKAHQTLTRRAFELILAFAGIVSALMVVGKFLGLLRGGLMLAKDAMGLVMTAGRLLFAPLLWIGGLARTILVQLALKIGMLAEAAFPALSEAALAFGAALEATPVGWIIAGIAALVVVIHDLWTILTGGDFKDTWISKIWEAIKGVGGSIMHFFGIGKGNDTTEAAASNVKGLQNLNDVPNLAGGGPDLGATPGAANSSYSVNAPITINVPAGTDHRQVGDKVKEGVKEHMDRVYRETSRSLRPAQAY